MKRLSRLLRASFLALLVLGMALKPALASIGETHDAEHAALAAHAHGHAHDHDHEHDHGESTVSDDNHAQGTHGLMHMSQSGGACTDAVPAVILPRACYGAAMVPLPRPAPVPQQYIQGPFRPPIA